jgi:hypothetical protein
MDGDDAIKISELKSQECSGEAYNVTKIKIN